VIGTLVGMGLALEQNFMAIAIPAVIAMVAVLFISEKRSASAHYNGVDVTDAVPSNSVGVAQAPK
jgi:AAHS family benzoate transporter-like MFS transporter